MLSIVCTIHQFSPSGLNLAPKVFRKKKSEAMWVPMVCVIAHHHYLGSFWNMWIEPALLD